MGSVTESIVVAATPERAWQAVVDFESRTKYSSRVKEAKIEGGGPLKIGSRIRLKVDNNTFTPQVIEMRLGQRLATVVKMPGIRFAHTYEVQPDKAGAKISITGQCGGPVGLLMTPLVMKSARRDLKDELTALKAAAEANK